MGRASKRGAEALPVPSGSNAAILVMVIAAFILLYILFLPKGEREEVLKRGGGGTVTGEKIPGAVLILENPGVLTRLKDDEFEHGLPSLNLFSKKEDAVLKSIASVHVENSRSAANDRSIVLSVKEKVENALLSFSVKDHSGVLIIRQNDAEIFRGEVKSFIEPIGLELEDENVFEFSTEPVPWWKPFSKNFYNILDVKFTATVEKLDNKEARQTVIVGQEEANLLSEATLSYFVECNLKETGKLTVYLNEEMLASKVPDCGSLEKLQIDPSAVLSGKNEFRFVAEKGAYLIDRIMLRTELEEPIFPLYFFSINGSTFRRIENNSVNSTLSLRFVDDKERKTADIEINNQKTRVDTRAANYSKNVDSFLIEGTNFLRIVTDKTLNLVELKLILDCRKPQEC